MALTRSDVGQALAGTKGISEVSMPQTRSDIEDRIESDRVRANLMAAWCIHEMTTTAKDSARSSRFIRQTKCIRNKLINLHYMTRVCTIEAKAICLDLV
jgi:hypothetical protein